MKEQIAHRILDEFVSMSARAGHCIPERWILHSLRPSLNPKEQMEIDPAIDDLRTKGFIEVDRRMGMQALILTVAGYDAIFPDDPEAAAAQIRRAILNGFAHLNSRVGHCLDERWILHKLTPTLTPRERDQLEPAIRAMAQDGLIDLDKRLGMTALILTQKGFDAIY